MLQLFFIDFRSKQVGYIVRMVEEYEEKSLIYTLIAHSIDTETIPITRWFYSNAHERSYLIYELCLTINFEFLTMLPLLLINFRSSNVQAIVIITVKYVYLGNRDAIFLGKKGI